MPAIPQSIILSLFRTAYKLLVGKGIGKLPGAMTFHDFLFFHLWPRESIVEIQGSKMYLNLDILPERFKKAFGLFIIPGVWERLTTEMFRKVVREGDIVVDLGANIGYFTLLASRLVGKEGKVYAFEPEPANYGLLIKNIEINGYRNIIPVQKVVFNTSGTVKLFIDGRDAGGHRICKYDDDKAQSIEIESVTLDDYFRDKGHPINVIKMDIEGAETAALLGMNRIIRENENLKIFAEFAPYLMERMGYSAEEFARKLIEDWHFKIMAMDDHTKNKRCVRINSVGELMDFCKGSTLGVVNLFIEKAQFHKNQMIEY